MSASRTSSTIGQKFWSASRTLLSRNLISKNFWEHSHVADLFPDEICEN
ncbi:hypothetical protein MTR67_002380 [Solanum verrucosum]|uniref:Uncharacterized protein n=1 Tax=Solanum verrucosum TaxID=315347 RepID=A0AAF0TD91_SOLVR|nr:hypothetical protein MTR67_002380 [Solanum verrucosum]